MNLTLVAKITPKENKAEELKKELEALLIPVRAEKGCMHYDLHYSQEEDGVFLFHETWATVKDWDAHMESDLLKAFFAKEDELIESVDLSKWTKSSL